MDRGLRFLCQAETRRLVSFLGITVALVLVVQYSELPYTKLLSSLTTKITSFSMDNTSWVNSKMEGDNINPNGSISSSSYAFEQISSSPQASQLDQFYNFTTRDASSPMGSVQGKDMNLTAPSLLAPQPMVSLPNRTTPLGSETDSRSPMISVTFNATSVKSDTTGSVYKDEKSGSLQGNNLTLINDKPPLTTKNSRKKPSKVVTISEMNLLLLRSHASSQLVKPTWSSAVDLEILHAKSEIENAPIIVNDSRLYSPLYRNVSMFKRHDKQLSIFNAHNLVGAKLLQCG